MEKEMFTIPEHLSTSQFLVGFGFLDLQFSVCFFFAIGLSVLRFTDSD